MADFQRARSPEQVAERRTAILAVARTMLADQPLTDISLRELSSRVGLAKSNVLRYFESREAIFLAVLDEEWGSWATALEDHKVSASADERKVAHVLAQSLASAPLLCELWGALAGVLERKVDAETARQFKVTSSAHADKVEAWIVGALPVLKPSAARQIAAITSLLAGALSAYQRPSAEVADVAEEFGGFSATSFEENLRQALIIMLVGRTRLSAPA